MEYNNLHRVPRLQTLTSNINKYNGSSNITSLIIVIGLHTVILFHVEKTYP